MRLTQFTDYSLRVLIYLGVKPNGFATITEVANRYAISRSHLMKVVHRLGQLGYLKTVRGKGGGIHLGRAPEEINLGRLIQETEPHLHLVRCFGSNDTCSLSPNCGMQGILSAALQAFLDKLEAYTLADAIRNEKRLWQTLVVEAPVPAEP